MHIEEMLKKYDLDPEIFNPMKSESEKLPEIIKEEPVTTTDEENNLEDPDIQEDVSNLLTPDICRKDCVNYDPVKPSEANGNTELIEFCNIHYCDGIPPGNSCPEYKNKNERLDLDGCLSF